jgi:hypothetical protein
MATASQQTSSVGAPKSRSAKSHDRAILQDRKSLQSELEGYDGVKNIDEGRSHLTNIGWLKANKSPTYSQLAHFLLFASKSIKDLSVANIVKSVAYIIDRPAPDEISADLTDSAAAKIKEITDSAIKAITEHSVKQIGSTQKQIEYLEELITRTPESQIPTQSLEEKLDTINEQIGKLADAHKSAPPTSQSLYSNAVKANPPSTTANPVSLRIYNKIQIQAKQVLIDFDQTGENTPRSNTPETCKEYRQKLAETIAKIPDPPNKNQSIQNLTITPQGQILVEFNDRVTAEWFRKPETMKQFLEMFDTHATYKPRTYPVVLKFIPIPYNIEDPDNLRELEESSGCKSGDIAYAKWIKPPERRRQAQKHAHAKIYCISPDVANHLITSIVRVNGKVVATKRDTWEPAVCKKCQRYGHYTGSCTATQNTCGKCGDNHRTSECESPNRKCTPCGSTEHTTNSDNCPEYTRRVRAVQERAPENLRPLYPTESNWMCQDGDMVVEPRQYFPPFCDPEVQHQRAISQSPRKSAKSTNQRGTTYQITNTGIPPFNRQRTKSPQRDRREQGTLPTEFSNTEPETSTFRLPPIPPFHPLPQRPSSSQSHRPSRSRAPSLSNDQPVTKFFQSVRQVNSQPPPQ